MKKGSKGFTLVELLATIVIMGILLTLGLPTILNMISSNRKKIYISDTQKLITKAEYKLKANSSDIERPDPGDCIIISLIYLDDESFDNPPFEGEYEKDVSFVVVKNTDNGDLEYSAMLVERTKDNVYQGVELTRDFALQQRDAIKHVKTFDKSELDEIRIKDDYNDNNLDKTKINQMLKKSSNVEDNYISRINGFYNYPKMADSTVDENALAPKIDKIIVESTYGKTYKSLDATLSLSISDKDSPKSAFKIYISTIDYNDAKKHKYTYSDLSSATFNQTFDFSKAEAGHGKYDYDSGGTITFYIIVVDERGLEDRKTKDYEIHKNTPPTILEDSSIYRNSSDSYNDVNAIFKLNVDDDLDDISSLDICYTENRNATSCSDYHKYGDLFNDSHETNYTFKDCTSSGCPLNGSMVTLKVFVKDSYNAVAEHVITPEYQLHANEAPTLQPLDLSVPEENYEYITISSYSDTYPVDGSLKVLVNFLPTDDITETNNINVVLREINASGAVIHSTAATKYEGHEDGFEFEFQGKYDGKPRYLQVVLTDQHGLNSDLNSAIFKASYTVYKNQVPTLEDVSIVSSGPPCKDTDFCTEDDGGNKEVYVTGLEADDDLDSKEKLRVCVSLNENDCTSSNPSKFIAYSEFQGDEPFTYDVAASTEYPYDGSIKNIYVGVMDTNNDVSNIITKTYQLYQNKLPEMNGDAEIVDEEKIIHVTSTIIDEHDQEQVVDEDVDLSFPVGKFKYRFSINDDLSDNDDMKVKVCYRLKDNPSSEVCGTPKIYGVDEDNTETNPEQNDCDDSGEVIVEPSDDIEDEDEDGDGDGDGDGDDSNTDVGGDITDPGEPPEEENDENLCVKDKYYYEEDIDLGLTRYTGQVYEIYAIVTDSYYEKTASSLTVPTLEYTVYEDVIPEVQSAYGVMADGGYKDDTMKVGFVVSDPYDTYQICVNDKEDASLCTKYVGLDSSTNFNGTDLVSYSINYQSDAWKLKLNDVYDENSTETQTFYLFVKDSYGNVSNSYPFEYSNYETCKYTLDDDTKEEIFFDSPSADSQDNNSDPGSGEGSSESGSGEGDSEPGSGEGNSEPGSGEGNSEPGSGEGNSEPGSGEGNSTPEEPIVYNGNPITDNEPISSTRCDGRCYYWESLTTELAEKMRRYDSSNHLDLSASDTDGIFGYYKKRLTHRDKNIPDIYCVRKDEPFEVLQLGCNYVDCFYNPKYKQESVSSGENVEEEIVLVEDPSISPYLNYAIGLIVRHSDVTVQTAYQKPIMEEIIDDNNQTAVIQTGVETEYAECNDYYDLYETKYDTASHKIFLQRTDIKICTELMGEGNDYFSFDSADSVPYIRVLDDRDEDIINKENGS